MQVRFSTAIGLAVVDEDMTAQLGVLSGILIHPDTGKVEGFFVRIARFLHSEELFLSSLDILRWGMRIVVRDGEVLSPLSDRIRQQQLFEEGRTVLHQKILTDTGRTLGRCADVQFDTLHFVVEWLWPKKFWRLGTSLPASQIIEVRRDAIIVRDPSVAVVEKVEEVTPSLMPQFPEAA